MSLGILSTMPKLALHFEPDVVYDFFSRPIIDLTFRIREHVVRDMMTQLANICQTQTPFYDELDAEIRVAASSMDLISQLQLHPIDPLSPIPPRQIKASILSDPAPHPSPTDCETAWPASPPTRITKSSSQQPPLPAWEAVCSRYPDIPEIWAGRPKDPYTSQLAHLPAYNEIRDNPRAPKHRRAFSLRRKSNIRAVLIQASGEAQDGALRCARCVSGMGPWDRCIRTRGCNDDSSSSDPLRGSCANCFYNGSGSKCNFSQPNNSKFPFVEPSSILLLIDA